MPEIKLTYFNIRARGETARLILAYAGQQFTDERLERGGSEIADLQAAGSLRYNQLPVLTVDGEKLYQSMAICRYLANKFGLGGANNLQSAQIDEVVDAINDIFDKISQAFRVKDPAEKEEKMKAAMEHSVPESFRLLEKCLANKGGQFLAGNSFSWADLHFLHIVDMVIGFGADAKLLEATPKLGSLVARTRALPNIATWLATRPITPF